MGTGNQSFLGQVGALWSRINPSQQLVVAALSLILLVTFAIWLTVARQPNYALLYGGLSPTDAGAIVSELQSRDVPYKLREGGKSIHVPADQVDELRIDLASGGLTPTGTTGYEILDKSPFGMSDRLQRVNDKRAIEGELARTLMTLKEVSAARVHPTLPEATPFIAERIEPAASVVLQLNPPGITLDRQKIAAVRTFVAGAIGTQDPNSVTIIDQNMNLLTGPTTEQAGALAPSQEEARRNFELQRTADIRSLLERKYGVGKVAICYSCKMDFDQVQTESLTYDPVQGSDHGVLVSSELTETSSKGENSTGGVPGTESNVPSYPAVSGQPFQSESATETKNFDVSQTHEMRTTAPGTILSSSVGVLIDKGGRKDEDILPSERRQVEELVASSAGINTAEGDVLTVAFMDFNTDLQTDLLAGQKIVQGRITQQAVLSWFIAIAALLVFVFVLFRFLKPVEKGYVPVTEERVVVEEELPRVELPSAEPAILERIRVREEIERLIKEDPASAAKVIKTWLQE
jgi:flagellar M-ring protein FliF